MCLTALCLSLPVLADSPSAMISSLNGSAMVIVDGKEAGAAEPMMPLAPKTLVEVRSGATMSVVFPATGEHDRITGPALIGIGQNRAKVFKGADSALQVVSTANPLVKAVDPAALGEGPSSGSVKVTQDESSEKITFSWTDSSNAGPYMCSVFLPAQGAQERTNVWSIEQASTSVVYDGPDLKDLTTYVVEVQNDEKMLADGFFQLAGGSVDMLAESKAQAEKMMAANPQDATPHVLMHTVYAQMGKNDEAGAALYPAMGAEGGETAYINRMNAMGQKVNAQANADTAYAQGMYAAEDAAWDFAPFWSPGLWDGAWGGSWDYF